MAWCLLAPTIVATAGEPRQWHLSLTDPARDDRPVAALVLGPAEAPAPCPVAVLGHATATPVSYYHYLAEPLARSGWLVVLPTTEGGLLADQAALAADMLWLARLLRDGSPALPGDLPPISPGPAAMLGHSLGGGAAVLAAAAAPQEVGVLAVMAPQDRPRPSMIRQAAHVAAPSLVLAGQHDCLTPPERHQGPLFENLASDLKVICTLREGGHCGFAGDPEPCTSAEAECAQLMPAAEQQELTLSLVLPWLAWQLRGCAAAAEQFRAAAALPVVLASVGGTATAAAERGAAALRLAGGSPGSGTVRWLAALPPGQEIRAEIYDARGRRVRRLAPSAVGGSAPSQEVAPLELAWDGRDGAGRRMPAGVYLLRVCAGRVALHGRCVRVD